jgi:hypothetical protein
MAADTLVTADLDKTLQNLNAALEERKNLTQSRIKAQSAEEVASTMNLPLSPSDKKGDILERQRTAILKFEDERRKMFTIGGGMKVATDEMDDQIAKFQGEFGKTIPMAFRDGLVSAMKAATDGTKNLKEGLLGVALAFGQKINDVLMNNIANQITSPLTKAFTPGYASGGYIQGGSGSKDDVPAMLMGGEYVISKSAVRKYGTSFFDSLNKGGVQKFATGGIVGGEIDITKPIDKNMSVYGTQTFGALSFDKDGNVIGIANYTGREEDKGDALKRAQTDFYQAGAQTGEGGYYVPGQYGQGAIMGQKSLLSFITQQSVSNQFDTIRSTRGGASIDLAGGSSNLTISALKNQDNVRNAEYLDAKSKALDLYLGGIDAAKSKAQQDEDNRIQYEKALEEIKKQQKEREKQLIRGLITQFATAVAMAGISAAANAASQGNVAAKQAYALGQTTEKPGFFTGMFSGAKVNGETYGGLSNMLNSNAYRSASIVGIEGGGARFWNSDVGKYETLSTSQYEAMFPRGVSWNKNMVGTALPYSWKRAAGGYVPGQGANDDVPTMLRGGEFVMSKQAASNIGYGNLQRMNSTGRETSESSNDMAARLEAKLEEIFEKVSGVGSIEINIESNGRESTSQDQDSGKDAQNRELAKKVKEVVLNVLREEKRLGGMLR